MEDRGNKTIMSSVLFLDIVEYSKKSVSGQISLKDRFNSYLSAAIRDVPISDRIILDTGDGAAINFLGDVEDALKAALSLRESLRNEDPAVDPPLLVRAGINLGPVRLVRDINGQPNIVGDGINVAQRVMGFAAVNQTLVSRSYYDAVSRLSPQYVGLFHYLGSRTDKHVREHEVYVVGNPGEKTSELAAETSLVKQQGEHSGDKLASLKAAWQNAAAKLDSVIAAFVARFAQADSKQRAIYVAAVAMPIVLVGTLLFKLAQHSSIGVPPVESPQVESVIQPGSAVTAASPVTSAVQDKAVPANTDKQKAADSKPAPSMSVVGKSAVHKATEHKPADAKLSSSKAVEAGVDAKKPFDQPKHPVAQAKPAVPEPAEKKTWLDAFGDNKVDKGADGYINVACSEGTLVFVDSVRKGKIGATPLNVAISPGKHLLIVTNTNGAVHSQNIQVDSGKTLRIKPNFCD